jgi:putative chitinase
MADIFEVISQGLNLRAAPGDGEVISVLPKGQVVEKLGEAKDRPDWWKVHTTVGKLEEEGFVSKGHLKAVDPKNYVKVPFLANLKASFKRLSDFVGPYASKFNADMLPGLNQVLTQYGINKNPKRFTHFMAQLAHESGHFSRLEENLKYSGDRLWELFRKHFKDEAEAQTFSKQAEKIANRIYCNRMGNGDEASGDGWKYRGRGFIQLTGRNNYREIGQKIGVDLETMPDVVATDVSVALKVACAYWDSRALNTFADADDLRAITKKINGGYIGLDDRQKLLDRAKAIWG